MPKAVTPKTAPAEPSRTAISTQELDRLAVLAASALTGIIARDRSAAEYHAITTEAVAKTAVDFAVATLNELNARFRAPY